MSPQGDEKRPEGPDEPERPEPPKEPEQPDEPEQPAEPEQPEKPEKPEYTVYGSGGRKAGKRAAPKPSKPAEPAEPAERPGKPEYSVYRSRPSLRDRLRKPDVRGLKRPTPGLRSRLSGIGGERRWLRWVLIGIGGWLLLSFITFAISAQIQKGDLPDSAKEALAGGPDVLAGQNILILGGDRRGDRQGNSEGVEAQGPPRADTIMVLHAGLTSFRKLSIPRDTYASIPNCGEQRINASLACNTRSSDGNPASTIRTVSDFLGIDINHIVIIDFDGFADFINTMGGIEVKIKEKVCGDVDGGKKQGGVSIQLKAGEHTLQGDKALALARIRKNECQPDEDDTDRAARQQVLLNGIKGRMTSITRIPYNFIKGPWIGWNAPKAFISDMGGFTLPQVAIAAVFGGSGSTNVLGREPDGTLHVEAGPDGSLVIPQGECERAVEDLTGGPPDRTPECSPD